MKLTDWAKQQGIGYRSAWNLYKSGRLEGAYSLPSGTIIVPDATQKSLIEYTVIYARVSSSENKPNLETQADRVSQFCAAKGWIVKEIV